ncbi:MAG: hypothetical protein JWQ18_1173 [Conexibacter sp.]|nr:hypothetical protein [Conexibacter sp.]
MLASCGGGSHKYSNAERPPTPIVISASINDKAVSVSPRKFGAGPITLIISNQSTSSQQVTLETADDPGGSSPGVKAIETGPINPRETASVKGEVKQGTYSLKVGADGVRAARLTVGKQRASSQNDLLQP